MLVQVIDYFAVHGVGDISMRSLATEIGTSHRMLNYYFGSRDGLLSAVVEAVELDQRVLLDKALAASDGMPRARLERFWKEVSDVALTYGPLFFELSGHAMLRRPYAESLRQTLITPWLDTLEVIYRRSGYDRRRARVRARLNLAVARGLLFDLLVSGDRAGVDAAMRAYVRDSLPQRPR